MLRSAITFPVIVLIAAALGLGGLAGSERLAAKIVFGVALALFMVSALAGVLSRARTNPVNASSRRL